MKDFRLLQMLSVFCLVFLAACGNEETLSEDKISPLSATELIAPTLTPAILLDQPTAQDVKESIEPTQTQSPFQDRWIEYENALAARFLPGSKGYCEWEILGHNKQEIYLWAICQTQFSVEGAAMSAPAVIYFDTDGNIKKVKVPKDGSQYGESIRELFPEELHEKIFSHSVDVEIMWDHIQLRHSSPEPPLIVLEGTELP